MLNYLAAAYTHSSKAEWCERIKAGLVLLDQRPAAPVADAWPTGPAYKAGTATADAPAVAAADIALNDLLLPDYAKGLLEKATAAISKEATGKVVPKLHRIWGDYYAATSASELQTVFRNLPTNLISRPETLEISVVFTAIGAILAASAILLSLLWHPLP